MSVKTNLGVTINSLQKMRRNDEKIACLTAYDAAFAKVLDDCGIDVILVGDSLGMVIQGHTSTVVVTMEDIVYHTQCVASTTQHALVIADMPFMSYTNIDSALRNATKLMQVGGAQMVKLEATQRQTEIVAELSKCGIPVCAHLGLRPQYIHKIGGYQTQGSDDEAAAKILRASTALEEAGADIILVECIPTALTEKITAAVDIPVIGIGAGKNCSGQILVLHDILGITPGQTPPFAKNYMNNSSIQDAIKNYIAEVKSGTFPPDT